MVTKAIIAKIDLGIVEPEGLMLPNGRFAFAVPQVADIFPFVKSNAQRDIKALMGKGFQFDKCISELNPKPVNIMFIEDFKRLTFLLAQKGNIKAIEMWNSWNPELKIQTKQKTKRKNNRGYIYLFEGSNVLKLGYTKNVLSRLKQLSRWQGELELVASVISTIDKEKSLHQTLHLTGDYFGDEWYPLYRKNEILQLMDATSTITADELVIKALDTF